MALAWNTRELLSPRCGEAPTQVEFHFASRREIYDSTIITADRHHSSAGEWAVYGHDPWYSVRVVTRPVYVVPQELCLSFGCYPQTVDVSDTIKRYGPPIEDVALEFGTLLSLLIRDALVPLGTRRNDGKPVKVDIGYGHISRPPPANELPPKGINSKQLRKILAGLAFTAEENVDAIIAACRLYHSALSLSAYDISTAYFLLVAAIECLSGHHLRDMTFDFDEVKTFEKVSKIIEKLKDANNDHLLGNLKDEMLRAEYFVWQKFRAFILEFLPEEFWYADELHPHDYGFPRVEKINLGRFIRAVYDARSAFAHSGAPFPEHVEIGVSNRLSGTAVMHAMALAKSTRFVPIFPWFERLTHLVLREYLFRVVAPEVADERAKRREKRDMLLAAIDRLPPQPRECLKRLAQWTIQFSGSSAIGPMAPNGDWAIDEASIQVLIEAGLIEGEDGKSWIKNREIGEVIGEYFFGVDRNPLKDNTVLQP
jgi:hypothetical protein